MAALVLPGHALNNTKTLILSRSFRAISAPQTLSLSPLSLSVGSSLLKPLCRKASHLVYCTQGPPPPEELKELTTVKKVEEWMDEALSLLHREMWGKIFQDFEIADDLLREAKCAEIWADDEWVGITEDKKETPRSIISKRHDEIETAVRAIEKLADWSRRKLKEFSEKRTTDKLQELKQGKYQILTAVTELMEQDMAKTDERIGKEVWQDVEEEVKEDVTRDVEELEAPGKLEDETTEAITERKLQKWMNEAVAWLKEETEQQIKKGYEIAEDLLSEARDAESYAVSRWDQHDRLRHVNIAENAIKKLADWSARKLKELSELPKKSKLQEFRERKDAILKELPEMMKPHELKEQKRAFIQRFDRKVDETEAKKDVLDSLKDQKMVGSKKTVDELGKAYEMAKKLADEAEAAFILANMEASIFRNLSEKEKKAVKKLAADWLDAYQ